MEEQVRLGKFDPVAFVTVVDVERAKAFYRDTLGLRLVSEEPPFALVFDAHGIMLRLSIAKELTPMQGTVLGWKVPEIVATVKELAAAGVAFQRYEFLPQDEHGIWTTPTGAKVAWFKDPDGNVLSLSEHPEWEPDR
jgi:catechol 2,3-dioxygenase-like lactoylglutathione lyase family enzyme